MKNTKLKIEMWCVYSRSNDGDGVVVVAVINDTSLTFIRSAIFFYWTTEVRMRVPMNRSEGKDGVATTSAAAKMNTEATRYLTATPCVS